MKSAMRRAMIFGSVMASFNVEEFGTERVRRLTHEEINDRFRAFKRMTHFDEIPFEVKAQLKGEFLMFCPTCEAEYEPGITVCPDDNTQLVERLTPITPCMTTAKRALCRYIISARRRKPRWSTTFSRRTAFVRW